MPNEFDTNKNQLDLFSYAESKQNQQDKRQKLASSGFTATVWTLSGVVLAACSLFEDDEGGAGGGSVSVLASPVEGARLYFDINGDGIVNEEDVRIQNEQYPGGFITGPDGQRTGIPLELHGRPYIALLDGATDAATGQALEGQVSSLEDEDGNHLIASPITDLIADAMADPSLPNTVSGVVAEFTPIDVDGADILAELRNRDSYLPDTEDHSPRIVAASKYLADNQAKEVLGRGDTDTIVEQILKVQRIIAGVDNAPTLAADDTIVVFDGDDDIAVNATLTFTVGEHDTYIGLVNAYSRTDGATLTYEIVDPTTNVRVENGDYTINPRGVISAVTQAGQTSPRNTDETLRISISDGTNTEYVDVTIDANDAHELVILQEDGTATVTQSVESAENNVGADVLEGIQVDGTPAPTAADFVIRDAFPEDFDSLADKFEIDTGATPDTWKLKLKDGEYLDYEAIPGGSFNLHVSVLDGTTPSNELTITVMVGNVDDISFSGTLRADLREDETTPPSTHLIAEGQVQIANQDLGGSIQPVVLSSTLLSTGMPAPASGTTVETLTLDHGTFTYNHADNAWTYTVNNDLPAIQALLEGQATTEIVTLTIDGGNGIMHTQSIVLNVHGANEDVHFVDENDVRTSTANVPDAMNIEIGDETALNGSFALGNVLTDLGVTLRERLSESETTTVAFADSVDAELRALFSLTPDGDLAFAGTNAQAVELGTGIQSLNLLVSTPLSTTEDIRLTVRVNVVNLIDNDGAGSAIYEIDGDTSAEGNLLTAQIAPGGADVDGVMAGSERYQWYRGDDAANGVLVGSGSTYTVQTDDVDETITLIVNYTDGSGAQERSEAATTPVRITRPTAAELEFAENQAGETLTLTATSSDDQNNSVDVDTFMFVYTDQNGQEQVAATHQGFSINNQGVITLSAALDYETASSYDLRIRATDANGEVGHLSITIRVGDVNDNAPVFDPNQVTTVAIDETLGNGQSVGLSVSATDADGTTANSTVTYSVTGGTGMGIFDVDSSSGVITVLDASMIDYESGTTSYTLIIGASDGLDASGTDDPTFTADTTTTITINISDVNDESPSVLNHADTGSARITAAADNPSSGPGTGMGYTVTVSDADADASTLDVSLTSGDPRFEFVRQTGTNTWELYLIAGQEIALSELNNQLSFEYIVTDSGVGTTSPTGSFVLTVVDTPVEFTSPSVTTIPLDENNVANLAVATVTATSEDDMGNTVHIASFTLVNDFGGLFSISTSDLGTATAEASITIASANALDFETTESYSLRVVATDTAGEDNTLTLTINVGNEEEGDASYEVRLTDSTGASVTDLAVGVILTPTVTTADPDIIDTSSIRYQWFIGTNDPANYIQGARGQAETLTLQSGDDLTATYGVAITYTDGADNTETVEALTSSVSFDANFARSGILEETHSGGTLSYSANAEVTTATDTIAVSATSVTPGSPTITYDFASGGNPNNYFAIRANGAITWARETTFDFETLSEAERTLEIVVIATEVENSGTGQTGTGDTARVSIILTIQNEQEGDGTYIVRGNVSAGAELTAEVNDPDGTRSVTYEWYSINPANNARTVLGATQSITLPDAPDFDDSLTYHVDIVHIDNLGDRHEETLDASAVVFDIQKTDNTAFPSSIVENTDSLPVVVASLDGDTRTATYTFVGGDTITTSGVFTISQSGSTAGAITVNAPSDINFETAQEFNDGSRGYTLNVRATFAEDTANNLPEVTGDVVVTIIVTDVNEHAPVFVTNADDNTLSTGTDEIAEDAANGTRVGLFRATDADGSNNDVTYSLDDGGLGIFNIRAVDGTNNWEIYVANRTNLDFESATKSYTIEITASDGAEPAMTTTEAFTINITDVNDNDPVLSATPVWEGTLDFGVPENTGTNVHLFTVSATDADENPSLTYEIVSIDGVALASIANPIFGIDASDGRVGLAGQLDRETKASHEIVIRAVDEGGRASEPQTFTVTVGDVNDNKPELQEPVWASDYGDNGVPEDAYTGAPLQIFTATATDRDANNGFSYEIVSVDGVTYDSSTSIFSIHAASGRVGITSALDYETAPEIMDDTNAVIGRGHEIVIVAIDNSGTGMRSEPGTITVLVANADDGNATYAITGDVENNGMLSVAVDTADPDGLVAGTESYRWFILNSDGSVPAAGDTNGDVQDAGSDDGDDSTLKLPADVGSNVYGVVVTYRDNAGEMEEETVIASPLRFASSAVEGMIAENSAETVEVATVTAMLSTNTAAVPTYSLTDASGKFEISASGVITLKSGQTLDFENTPDLTDGSGNKGYVVTVDATTTDAGKTENAPPATVTIIVTDENDTTPVLAAVSDTKTATIAEDHQRGADVGDISFTITDADADTTNNFVSSSFTITAGTGTSAETAAKFEVVKNGDNWDLKVRADDGATPPNAVALDRETDGVLATGVINLDIKVNDGRPTAGDSNVISVEITVTDVNEFGPVFTETAVTQSIEENAAASPVSNANPASDGDATTPHNTIIYSIVTDSSPGFFDIAPSTGVISTNQRLDHESADLLPDGINRGYVLTLQAVDEGGLQAPEQQTLTIRVVDVNEAPVLGVSGSRTGTMSETDTETGIILTLDDPDAADQSIDASRFTFSDARFTVMKVAGQTNQWEVVLKPGESVNYETAADRSIALTVSVTDRATSGMTSNEETITVTVENANDNDPVLVAGSVAWENAFAGGAVAEADYGTGGTKIAQITATDPDRTNDANFGALIYSLTTASTSGYDTYFTLRADGELRVKGDVDFETIANKSFDLEVQVTDATTGGNTDTHTYTVTIDDVNEYDPVISPGGVLWNDPDVTGGAINEGSYSAGTTIAFATVTDADATNPAPLEFTLTKGDSIFSISNTGVITLKANTDLDADSDPTSYTLAYTVQNVGGNPGGNPIASGDITLTVTNINDNDPEYITGVTTGDPKVIWETGFPGGNILENTAIGTTLGKIQVRDADMDELMFEVVATPDGINTIDSKFEVEYEESTGLGLLKLKTALDLDDPDNPDPSTIGLQVIISDEDNDPNPIKNAELSDVGNLIIVNIQPVNEHMPALNFSGNTTTVNIDEQMPPSNGNGVNTGISFTVDDADSKIYRISDFDVSGDSRFRVEWSRTNQEGSIWLKAGATLDYEKTDPMDPTVFPDRSITLTLRVNDDNDADGNPVFATETLTINVDPTDDENPGFGNIAWIPGATTATTTDPTEANTMRTIREDSTATLLGTFLLTDGDGLSNLNDVSIDASGNPTDENGVALFTFTRNGASGVLSLNPNADLDYEHMTSHDLVLVVTDGANTPGVHRVTINVGPVDEGDAVFAPIAIEDGADLTAPAVGETLTFTPTPTTNDPDGNPASFTPTWFRQNSDGTGRVDIDNSGAMDVNQYTITTADVGKVIGVRVDYTDGGNHDESVVLPGLSGVVASDFTADAASLRGEVHQYDLAEASGTFTYDDMASTETKAKITAADTVTYAIKTGGESVHGTAAIDSSGAWTFDVNNAHADVLALNAGDADTTNDSLDTKFTVQVSVTTGGVTETFDQDVTVTINAATKFSGTAAGDTINRAAATGYEFIQGGDLNDMITVGDHGSVVVGGYGRDDITLGDGVDTVIHRFASLSTGWRQDDGASTIRNFKRGEDKLFLVDVDGVSPVTLATFLDATKSGAATSAIEGQMNIFAEFNVGQTELLGLRIEINAEVKLDGPGGSSTTSASNMLRILFDESLSTSDASVQSKYFGQGEADASSTIGYFDLGTGFVDFRTVPSFFSDTARQEVEDTGSSDNFDVIALADLDFTIL